MNARPRLARAAHAEEGGAPAAASDGRQPRLLRRLSTTSLSYLARSRPNLTRVLCTAGVLWKWFLLSLLMIGTGTWALLYVNPAALGGEVVIASMTVVHSEIISMH